MRLIDADALIKFIDNRYDITWKDDYEGGIKDACTDILEEINKMPTIEPQQWIPCSERLPEKEGWYITTVESEKTGKRRIENDLFAIDIALAHGLTPNKFCKDGHGQRTVAWCEFPEPWNGESEETV